MFLGRLFNEPGIYAVFEKFYWHFAVFAHNVHYVQEVVVLFSYRESCFHVLEVKFKRFSDVFHAIVFFCCGYLLKLTIIFSPYPVKDP